MNRYLIASFCLIFSFIILSSLIYTNANTRVSQRLSLYDFDYSLFLQINDSHYKPADQLMILLTQYGREVVWVIAGVLLLVFGGSTGREAVIVMAMTMGVLLVIGPVAKEIIGRSRPVLPDNSSLLIEQDKEFSFPSGHALLVSAGSAVMLALYRGSYRRLFVSVGLSIEAALVCFSRVYVGGHYPSDVIGGILLGVGVAFIFVASAKHVNRQIIHSLLRVLKR